LLWFTERSHHRFTVRPTPPTRQRRANGRAARRALETTAITSMGGIDIGGGPNPYLRPP
jgi:hypothetical protein